MRRLSLAAALLVLSGEAWALKVVTLKDAVTMRSADTGQQTTYDMEVVAGQALVKFKVGVSSAARDAELLTVGAVFARELAATGWSVVTFSDLADIPAKLTQLGNLSSVAQVDYNHAYRISRFPADPSATAQYHLGKVNAYAAWDYEVGTSSRVTVAVFDSGVQNTHSELSGKMTGLPHQFCNPGADKNDSGDNTNCAADPAPQTPACNHGTRVAGVAAASSNNGSGIAGISWGAQILSMKIFRDGDCSSDCSGLNCATDTQAIVDALNYVGNNNNIAQFGRMVANLSIGGVSACPVALQTAINNAVSSGVVVAVSAGNYAGSSVGGAVQSPGNCVNALPVGATDESDLVAGFSARGAELANEGVVAPGVAILTTDLSGNYAHATGTSFSAPVVSGIAALILAKKPTATVNTTTNEVQNIIRGSAESVGVSALGLQEGLAVSGNTAGAGRVNAFRAMKLTVDGTLAGFAGDTKAIAFPNPFRPASHGVVTITIPGSVAGRNPSVKIYTVDGQLVRDLGGNTTWDGKNGGGNSVATGTYIFVVKTDSGMDRGRIGLIR